MLRLRRTDHSPRLEMTPLIDVIFLLLTFFIYSLVLMVRADVLPVRLTPLVVGEQATGAAVNAVTVDRHGGLFYNREPVSAAELQQRMVELAEAGSDARLYIAVEAEGTTDRGPLLVNLLQQATAAGLTNIAIVGQQE